MITDREVLEQAATAMFGADGFEWNGVNQCIEYIPVDSVYYKKWRPLEDDGDALRLALTLNITIDEVGDAITPEDADGRRETFLGPADGGGKADFAATRYAIVRAAAKIAVAQPKKQA